MSDKTYSLFFQFNKTLSLLQDIKPWNMGTNQLNSCLAPLNNALSFRENAKLIINKTEKKIHSGQIKDRIECFVKKQNGNKEPLFKKSQNNVVAISTFRQKFDFIKGLGLISDLEYSKNKKLLSRKVNQTIDIDWTETTISKEDWNIGNGIGLLKYFIKNGEMFLCKYTRKSIIVSYLIAYFYNKNKLWVLNNLNIENFSVTRRGEKKWNNIEQYLFNFIDDAKNKFSEQWNSLNAIYNNEGVLNIIKDAIESMHPSNQNFVIKSKQKIDNEKFDEIKNIINNNQYSNIYDMVKNNEGWRNRQDKWKKQLYTIREMQGREKDDIDKYPLKGQASEAAHIVPVYYYKKLIKKAVLKSNKEEAIRLWDECWSTQNGMILPSDAHKYYDSKKAVINISAHFMKYESVKHKMFIPYNSFLKDKRDVLNNEKFKVEK